MLCKNDNLKFPISKTYQWFSGRVADNKFKDCRIDPHMCTLCVLEDTRYRRKILVSRKIPVSPENSGIGKMSSAEAGKTRRPQWFKPVATLETISGAEKDWSATPAAGAGKWPEI